MNDNKGEWVLKETYLSRICGTPIAVYERVRDNGNVDIRLSDLPENDY